MAFRVGDAVRVKPGVRDPDNPELDIGGWQGRVTDMSYADNVKEPTVGLAWDSVTLRSMPAWSIERCERDNLAWSEMYLHPEDLEPARLRDTQRDVERVQSDLQGRFGWLGIGPEGEHIQAVVNSASGDDPRDVLEAWVKELGRTLRFPFEAVVDEFQERSPFRAGDRVTVLRLQQMDEIYGILVICQKGQKLYEFPLSDLAARNTKTPNADAMQEYRTWFANR